MIVYTPILGKWLSGDLNPYLSQVSQPLGFIDQGLCGWTLRKQGMGHLQGGQDDPRGPTLPRSPDSGVEAVGGWPERPHLPTLRAGRR